MISEKAFITLSSKEQPAPPFRDFSCSRVRWRWPERQRRPLPPVNPNQGGNHDVYGSETPVLGQKPQEDRKRYIAGRKRTHHPLDFKDGDYSEEDSKVVILEKDTHVFS